MKAWTIGFVLICAVLPFTAARNHAEVHDDVFLRGPGSLVADSRADMAMLWRADLFASHGEESGPSGMWRPLVLLSFRAEHYLTNGSPIAYAWLGHVVNLALHALATVALLFLLAHIGLPEVSALIAAALFGLHPVHAESVAWLSGRSDLGATALIWCGAALMLYPGPGTRLRAALACLAMLGGLLFKETGLLLVCLVPLLGVLAGRPWRSAIRIPVTALGTYLVLRTWLFTREVAPEGFLGPDLVSVRWLTWSSILPDMVRFGVWPGPASPLRPVEEAHAWGAPGVINGAVLLLVLLALGAWAWRRRLTAPTFALALLCGTLIMFAPWTRYPTGYPEVAAPLYERYAYASAATLPILLGWLLGPWFARRASRLVLPLVAAVVLIAPITRARVEVWSSDESFARAGLRLAPRSVSMWNHLGVALLEQFRAERDSARGEGALAAFARALSIEPEHRLASLNQFITFVLLGRAEQATSSAKRLVERHGNDPAILDNIAHWHAVEGRWEQAAELFARELETGRALPGADEALGECLKQLGEVTSEPESEAVGG